jgi:predicted PurR-regulated permease PerM
MLTKPDLPLYLRLSQILMGIVAFFYILSIGQNIIVPIIFSLVVAILLNPFVNFLERKLNRIVAISIAIILATIVMLALLFFIGSQAARFSDSLPQLKLKFTAMLSDGIQWVSDNFNVSTTQIKAWIAKTENEGLTNGSGVIGQTLSTLGGVLVTVVLIPVYIFLFLFYKPLLLNFIAKLFPAGNHETVVEVLTETKSLIQNYLVGLMIEFVMISSLYTISLLVLGIEYALLLGVVGGLLNLIPYIGRHIAAALPMILALATKEPIYALYVFVAYALAKFIDNNFINPVIVASKVKINALVSVIVVLVGGALWGVAGMFLSLPLIAITKVVFDRIDPLKPFGFLLGDTMPPIGENVFIFRKKRVKNER